MISLSDTSELQKLIGSKIRNVASSYLSISDGRILSLEAELLINCDKSNLFLRYENRIGFFENEEGDVFYDYEIIEGHTPSNKLSYVDFTTPKINKIDVYGRTINPKDFTEYPKLYAKINESKKSGDMVTLTDDLFVFHFEHDYCTYTVFHPYLPRIEFLFNHKERKAFWEEYGELYKLHHTIK